jgi:DNA-binding PadR family transcriptional regulator
MFGDHSVNFDRHSNPFERRSRLFQKGDLKYVILGQLKDKPAHGYEITRALEERFHGFYSPSAGSVYPILQLLQDMGYVTSIEKDGKRVYTITEEGKKFLIAQEETTNSIKGRMRGWWGSGSREYLRDVKKALDDSHAIHHQIGRIVVHKDPAKIAKIKEILAKALDEIETLIDKE